MSNWNSKLVDWRAPIVGENLYKSKYKEEAPSRGINSLLTDPYSLQQAMGFKDRHYSISYNVLKQIPTRLSLISAIIQTRCNQVASFSAPYRLTKSLGYEIKHKNPERLTTKGEREMILSMEQFIFNCGHSSPNPKDPSNFKRDDFDTFLRKFVRDSLQFDQACLLPGAVVELADGRSVNIENLIPGDVVISHTGNRRKVQKVTSRKFDGDIVEVRVRGNTTRMTNTHPVFAAKRTSLKGNKTELANPEWVAAGDLTTEHFLVYPKYKGQDKYFSFPVFTTPPRKKFVGPFDQLCEEVGMHPTNVHYILAGTYKRNKQETKDRVLAKAKELGVILDPNQRITEPFTVMDADFAKMLGLYTAEGCIGPNSVYFTVHRKETDLVDFLVNFGRKYNIKATVHQYPTRKATCVALNCKLLTKFVLEQCGTGSKEKRVPSFVFDSPQDVREGFLWGYLVGDGSQTKNSTSFTTISTSIFYGVRHLLAMSNMYISHSTWTPRTAREGKHVAHQGTIGSPSYADFAERVGFPYKRYNQGALPCPYDNDYLYVRINELSHVPTEIPVEVFNCEVEEDNSFVANGFINHNCSEIVPTHKGTPYEFVCVDASTIRIAADSVGLVPDETWYDREAVVNNPALLNLPFNPYTSLKYRALDKSPAYVQVINGQITQVYTKDDMIFGVRNPRSDVLIQGYGFSELEQLVSIITSHLNAEEYNKRFFLTGSNPKGILNFKGDSMSPEQLEVFKRQWKSNVEGNSNSWATPILQSEQGLEWIDMHRSNSDMEYSKWVEYLIKIITGVYGIDPAEINFDLAGGVSQTPLFESSSEWKLKASRDKGLKPLLKFVAKTINDNIIAKIDDAFYFDFVGLDELTEQEKHELRTEQLSSYLTLNEVRRAQDLPDIEDGDVVLNPVYLQAKTTQMQLDAQKAQEPQQGGGPEQGNPGTGEQPNAQEEGTGQTVEAPSYADRFTKSVNNTKILEISLDDESWYDLV